MAEDAGDMAEGSQYRDDPRVRVPGPENGTGGRVRWPRSVRSPRDIRSWCVFVFGRG